MLITSTSNPNVQRLQKLLRKKKFRKTEGVFVAEGVRLLEEALLWGRTPLELYWGESISDRAQEIVAQFSAQTESTFQLADYLIDRVSETGTSQGVFGVFPVTQSMPEVLDFLLIADQIRDPGNLGTLMRSAKAMGVDAVITTYGTVDAYAPKVVRSAMGVHFALPIMELTWEEINDLFPGGQQDSLKFWTTVVDNGQSIIELETHFPIALVVGGEADGVSSSALSRSDVNVTIPMLGNTESLNAGIAGSIALYEIMRKRLKKGVI